MPLSALMRERLVSKLTSKLTDWLFVLLGVSIALWFFIRLPVLTDGSSTQLTPNVSQDRLKHHVKTLIQDYSPRTIEYGNLNITAHYIRNEFNKFGESHYQPYWTLAGRFSNVVLSLGPDTTDVFVIGAHYDAESDSLDVEGNASGVATLIELARHLSETKKQLGIKVILVAYPLSQKGKSNIENMGSYNHATLLARKSKKVKMMVSLDGVGRFNSENKSQKYPYRFMQLFYPTQGDYIGLFARLQDYSAVRAFKESFMSTSQLPLYSFNTPQNYSPTKSLDHINYQNEGFPAILISDTAAFRSNYSGDDVIKLLDYEKMSMLVEGLYQVIMDTKTDNDGSGYVDMIANSEQANLLQSAEINRSRNNAIKSAPTIKSLHKMGKNRGGVL